MEPSPNAIHLGDLEAGTRKTWPLRQKSHILHFGSSYGVNTGSPRAGCDVAHRICGDEAGDDEVAFRCNDDLPTLTRLAQKPIVRQDSCDGRERRLAVETSNSPPRHGPCGLI
jgi:hypothetical protein